MENKDNQRIVYFASDLHLGVPSKESSRIREKAFVDWLEMVSKDANEIYLLGDIFDMWFEYKTVVPRGYTRLLGKLAELSDKGISIKLFTGNHDMWMFGYFPEELNIPVLKKPEIININGLNCFIGHGDGLGKGDFSYKFLKAFFASSICQWLFARLHPNFGLGISNYLSKRSRIANGNYDEIFAGEEKELLIQFAKNYSSTTKIDYFIFGHRHLPMDIQLPNNNRLFNCGEWVNYRSYVRMMGTNAELLYYKD